MTERQLPTVALSDIFVPGTLTIEDYGNNRPRKVFIAGMYAGRSPKIEWHALYGDLQQTAREAILPNLVDGDVAAVQLRRQRAGPHEGKLVAVATPTCGIGQHIYAFVDSLGDCELPAPFTTLDDLAR